MRTATTPKGELRIPVTARIKRTAVKKLNKYCAANNIPRSVFVAQIVIEKMESIGIK